MEMQGIITHINRYGDGGGYVEILTAYKTFSFFVKNLFFINQKNVLLNLILSQGVFDIDVNKKILNNFFIDNSSFQYVDNVNKMIFIIFIEEAINKIFPEQERYKMFNILLKMLDLIKVIDKKEALLSMIAVFFALSLRLSGIGFNVDRCVITGEKTNLIGISFNDGGFVSARVFDKRKHKFYSKIKCEIFYKIFKIQEKELKIFLFPTYETFEIVNDLFFHLYKQMGIKFKSQELISKIM
ncbi:MAG: DNA repair protein RecO C-terminal domain-containing protein [Bacilli bacterium]|nr:DNA repair protein RecO C-terminal domain-containing protein [Bacilli bacterium]